ncbi:MAG TPA: 5-(carboxyamino)imidazole ribonucleotide synthase [Acidobacteriaceae bacterium]|nr:5-(carboxyamino)imidazole ribonucleotide synthase [Acidobacteriaceae bacterium]
MSSGNDKAKTVEPGGLIGILGGGQLGRMTAMAARTMGYRVRVMDPEAECPASFVVDEVVVGNWDDVEAARRLAAGADAVTLEIEQIGVDALREVAALAPLRPGVEPIRIIQDKILQKVWLKENGFPVGAFRVVTSEAALQEALPALGGRVFLKTARGGYDGRGQARIGFEGAAGEIDIAEAWASLGGRPAVAEQALELDFEISVMAARSPSGEVRSYPAARNHHERQILAWSVLPAGIPAELEARAQEIARGIIAGLEVEGLLCVEMFVTRQGETGSGELLVNELAPRPHNSYHQSERACATSQFEQLVRTTCNLPLGDTEILTPAAIVNLLGEVWLDAAARKGGDSLPDFAAALKVPGVRLHLYEKKSARVGRKMGHLSATGATGDEALKRVLEAYEKLAARE